MNNLRALCASWYCNCQLLIRWPRATNASLARHLQELSYKKNLKLLQNGSLVAGHDNQHWLRPWPSHKNCFKNSVATSRPRVFTDSFSSLISLSISWGSCKQNCVSTLPTYKQRCIYRPKANKRQTQSHAYAYAYELTSINCTMKSMSLCLCMSSQW